MRKNAILLVEDNEAIVMGLEYLLTGENFTFYSAGDKKSAREIMKNERIDLVLLDISLPDGNGFELCREIKKENLAPVIFLTAKDEENNGVTVF